MAFEHLSHRRDRCRSCSLEWPAWLLVAKRPEGSMRLYYLSQQHPDQVGPYLECMRKEDMATVAAEAYEVVEDQDGAT